MACICSFSIQFQTTKKKINKTTAGLFSFIICIYFNKKIGSLDFHVYFVLLLFFEVMLNLKWKKFQNH